MHSLPNFSITLPPGNLVPQGGHSQPTSKVPVIIGTIFGFLGLILLFVVISFLRRRRRRESAYINGPLEESRARQQGPSDITPFTDESKPHITNGSEEQNSGYSVHGNPPSRTRQTNEKSLTTQSPDPIHQTAPTAIDHLAGGNSTAVSSGRDEGNTPGDNNLRQDVEQLRRRVEMLSAQPPQVVYQPSGLPDELPPYLNN